MRVLTIILPFALGLLLTAFLVLGLYAYRIEAYDYVVVCAISYAFVLFCSTKPFNELEEIIEDVDVNKDRDE